MKAKDFKKVASVILCLLAIIGALSVSAFAAKEMFMDISEAGVTDIDAPVNGQKGDYTATPVHGGKYEITKIEYYNVASQFPIDVNETFKADTQYYVLVHLKAKSAYYVSTNSSTGAPNATVTCNGNTATAVSVGSDTRSEFAIKYLFPKTESSITEVNITGVDKPVHGEIGDTAFEDDNTFVTIGDIKWTNQNGTDMDGGFKYGETYVLSFYLFVDNSKDFAKDYSHPLATAEKPMPAVTVMVDGVKATVLPDYNRNPAMRALKASVLFTCDKKVV